MSIWVSSDLHFFHNKGFIYESRGFKSVEEMNAAIVKRHNQVVKDDDEVYWLGDLMLGTNYEEGIKLLQSMRGRKHIILGNHDSKKRIECYANSITQDIKYADMVEYKGYHFYLSHFPALTNNFNDNAKELKGRIINLCGHCHIKDFYIDTIKYNSLCFHIELDTNNCYPWNLDNIIEKIKLYGHF